MKQFKKRLLSVVVASAMALPLLTACGNNDTKPSSTGSEPGSEVSQTEGEKESEKETQTEKSGETVELEFWSWWSSEARKPHIEEIVKRFNDSQTDYHVTYVDIPWGDIFTKNIAQIAAGNPTDIMANSMEEVRFRASQGQVESIDDLLTDDVKGAFYEQYMDAVTGEDGKIYALPFSVDTRAIYYNKAQFEEAGIDPASIKTWADLEDAARKLDIKDGDKFSRYGFVPLLGNAGLDSYIINANKGMGWFDESTKEIKVNTDTNVEVLKWIRSQIDYYGQRSFDELSAAFSSGMADPFASGVVSMLSQTSAYTSYLKQTVPDMEYGVIQFPEFKEGNGHAINGGGFVVETPKGAKHPEGSYEFMKFITGKDAQDYISVNIGDFSARNDFDDSAEFFKNPINKDLAKALEETFTVITPNEFKGYQDTINPLLDQGTLGLTEPEQCLADTQTAFEDFVKNNS